MAKTKKRRAVIEFGHPLTPKIGVTIAWEQDDGTTAWFAMLEDGTVTEVRETGKPKPKDK